MSTRAIRWIDNHCHLSAGTNGDDEIEAAAAQGVERFIDVATDIDRSRQSIATAARHPGRVFATVGVHPHDANQGVTGLEELLEAPHVVAVGECGLDYHYDHSPRAMQRETFVAQIALANAHGLPLIIHSREAWDDTFAILDECGVPERTVLHCFTGGPAEAVAALERGAMISFSGIVTFANAPELRAALRQCPVDRIMVETDSPYLAPEPVRGRANQPANLPLVGRRMAEVLDVEVADLADQLWATTHRFYALPEAG